MRNTFYACVALGLACVMCGCQTNKTRVAEGAGIGGVLGALAGGIIGHQSGHGVEGALIGGAVGATGGAVAGAQIEKPVQDASISEVPSQLTMQQVVDLSKQGIPAEEIINRIKSSKSTYALTSEDVDYLKSQGVSQRVIETMQVK